MSLPYKIFDTFQDIVVVVDAERQLHYGNQSASLLFDVSAKRLKGGKPLTQFIEFKTDYVDGKELPLEEPTQYREIEFTTPQGKNGWVQASLQIDPETAALEPAERRWIMYMRDVSLEKTLHDKYKAELDQKEAVIVDLRTAQAQLEDYSKNLEKMVADRTRELRETNELLGAILDSLSQGIIVFDQKGRCLPFRSKAAGHLFESSAAQDIFSLVKAEADQRVTIENWLGALFDEMLPFEDMAGLGPDKYEHSEGRHIVLGYNPMRDSSGKLAGVVMVATDITNEVVAREEAVRERAFAKMVVQMASHRLQFKAFASETKKLFVQLLVDIKSSKDWNWEIIARHLHTIKGGAASMAMLETTHLAHESEQLLAEIRALTGDAQDKVRSAFIKMVETMQAEFLETLEKNKHLFGGTVDTDDRTVDLPVSLINQWLLRLENSHEVANVRQEIYTTAVKAPIGKLFNHVQSTLDELAGRLGKQVKPLKITGEEIRLVPEAYSELTGNIIHVFRNAMDHGLESPETRTANGKDPAGQIQLHFSESPTHLRIVIEDDGGGINPEILKSKLQTMPHMQSWLSKTDQEIIQVVFCDDFSTRTEVTDISGRGVGLPAVKASAETLGGKVWAESTVGVGTRFVIEVPHLETEKNTPHHRKTA